MGKYPSNRIVEKLKKLKEVNPFYKEKYKDINLASVISVDDFKQTIPLIYKEEIFNKNNIDKITNYVNGIIYPSAGTTSNHFSFRLSPNNTNEGFNGQLIDLFKTWFQVDNKKTLIINAYPLGVYFPEGPYTVVSTTTRSDIIIYLLDYIYHNYESVIILGQPHFIKHLLDLREFNELKINRDLLKIVIGGYWFPYTFEMYLLKRLYGNNWQEKSDNIKSTYGTAETGLGVLIDLPKNIRKYLYKGGINEIIPLVYMYDPQRYYIEEVDADLVITNLNEGDPELIRYNTKDKIAIADSEQLNKLGINIDLASNMIYLYGRGRYKENALITHNLFYNYEYAKHITGSYYIEGENIYLQLNKTAEKSKKMIDYYRSILDYKVVLMDYYEYKFNTSLDRKPITQ